MAFFVSKPDVGIDGKTSLVRYGNKRKLPYVWSSPTSIGSGGIRAWELQRRARAELTDHFWTWNDIATYPTLC
jgi:hypothetical protein